MTTTGLLQRILALIYKTGHLLALVFVAGQVDADLDVESRNTLSPWTEHILLKFRLIANWPSWGHCFPVVQLLKTWNDAQKFCTDRSSHLASIHTAEEQKFITSQLKHPAWIGLTDEDEEGRWKWSDDSWFTTQYWADGEPSVAGGRHGLEQDCTSIVPSTTEYNWKDDHCDQLHHWVCKQFRG
ncbi:snaclec VP12 subunit B-like [Tiliqua scincoides]|uniref:snaclec VP12 subunit B-like n=1 Tax=Tiliqua scincoides TaxID=71010 RepID=UPI003461CC0B